MLVYEEVIWNEEYYFNNELFSHVFLIVTLTDCIKNVMNF